MFKVGGISFSLKSKVRIGGLEKLVSRINVTRHSADVIQGDGFLMAF